MLLDWKFVLLSHNTVRGAAGATILNAELLASLGKLEPVAEAAARVLREFSGCTETMGARRMSVVVMKFGGTSVEDPAAIRRTAGIVAGRVAMGKRPVVVVSALAKVTDQLLRAGAAAAAGRPHRRARHQLAAALPPSRHGCRAGQRRSGARAIYIDQKFDSLDEVLRGLAAILELTPRISDLVVKLRRAHLKPHRGGGISRAWHRRRACGCARSHRHRLAVSEGGSAGRDH